MRKRYFTRSIVLAGLIALGTLIPKAPIDVAPLQADMALTPSPVSVMGLDTL